MIIGSLTNVKMIPDESSQLPKRHDGAAYEPLFSYLGTMILVSEGALRSSLHVALVSPSCVQSLNSRCRLSDRRVVDAPALSRCSLSRSASIRVLRQKCIAARPKHTANATPMPNPNHGAMVRSIVGGGGDGGESGGGGGGDGRGGDGGGGVGGSGGDAGYRGLSSTCFECSSSLKPEQRRNGSVQCLAPHAKQSGWSGTLAHSSLRSHSMRYVRHTFAFGAQGASCPAPLLYTYSAQVAGITRGPHIQYRGPGTYVSA